MDYPDINSWFGIEVPEDGITDWVEPNYLGEEPEEQAERLTKLIHEVTGGRVAADWRFEDVSSEGPVYRLLLDGEPTPIRTRQGEECFTQEVSDLVALLNGWDRGQMSWYRMGNRYQLRLKYTLVHGCYDDLAFEDAVAAAVRFSGMKWVGMC